mgnify:CR=1 FL=1
MASWSRRHSTTYAQARSGVSYHIGEHVDDDPGGKVIGHESHWRAGEKGSRAVGFMPSAPKVGDGF